MLTPHLKATAAALKSRLAARIAANKPEYPMKPVEYCERLVAAPGMPWRYALRKVDPALRADLLAVEALAAELAAIVRRAHEPRVAEARLNWWREEYARARQGRAESPVGQALSMALGREELAEGLFEEMFDAADMDRQYTGYRDWDDLALYLYRRGSARLLLQSAVLGGSSRCGKAVHALGQGLELVALLKQLGQDASFGRLYLPSADMERFSVRPADFMQPQVGDALRGLLDFEAERARALLDQGEQALAQDDAQRLLMFRILADFARQWLDEVRADNFALLDRRIELTPWRLLWRAWRVKRAAVHSFR